MLLFFSETNIKTEEETLFFLENFDVVFHSRGGRRGSGVMVAINNKLKIIKYKKKIKFPSTEALHVELDKNKKIILCIRPLSSAPRKYR